MVPTVNTPPPSMQPTTPSTSDRLRLWGFGLAVVTFVVGAFFTLDARADLKVATAVAILQDQISRDATVRTELMLQEVQDRKAADAEMEARYIHALERLADAIDKLRDQQLADAASRVREMADK